MGKYYCRELRGNWYVIHRQSGVSLQYHSQRGRQPAIPSWKYSYMEDWVFSYSNTKRKKVKMESYQGKTPAKAAKCSQKVDMTPYSEVSSKNYDTLIIDEVIYRDTPQLRDVVKAMRDMQNYGNTFAMVDPSVRIPTCNVEFAHTEPKKEKEKGNTMYFYDTSIEATQRNALSEALTQAYHAKESDLRKAYGLDDDTAPKSAKEFIKRIQDGKFVLPKSVEESEEDDWFDTHEVIYSIRWRDPDMKEDRAGYKTAQVALDQAHLDARLEVGIKDLEAGLDVVKTFKSATFH